MSDNINGRNGFNEAVAIKADRVFDSCSDKTCFSDLPVILHHDELSCNISIVKNKCVKVDDVSISVEPLPFNRGFYACNLTYTFRVELYAYEEAGDPNPQVIRGKAYATQNCILFGSEGNTKTFYSNGHQSGETNPCCEIVNLPTVAVSVVDPVLLGARIACIRRCENMCCPNPPTNSNSVLITLGLFSVVELIRPVTILVPTYPYSIPQKACCYDSTESPCDLFEKIKFPTEKFSPPSLSNSESEFDPDCGCGAT